MADNNTKIVITAEDRASATLGKVTQSMGMLARSIPALGLAGGIAGSALALAAMAKNTIDAADNMNDLSQKVGISIQNLAGWQLAANQSGTSMETVARGVKGLSGYMNEHAKELKAAGITAKDADGAMVQLADIFKAMPDGVEKTALAVKLFGKSGMDMIPMLNEGSAGLQTAKDKAAEYGRKMAELAPQADQFNDTMEELALHSKAFGINLVTYAIGPMNQIAKGFADMAAGGDRFWGVMNKIGDAGHPAAKALLAWRGILSPEAGRSANGWELAGLDPKTGQPKTAGQMLPGGNSPAEAAALARARLLNPSGGAAGGGAKKSKAADFGPDDVLYNIEEAVRKQNRDFIIESQKAEDALTAKTSADNLQRLNSLLAATPTGQLQKAREEMQLLAAALEAGTIKEWQFVEAVGVHYGKASEALDQMGEFTIEAARNMQDAFADFLFDPFSDKTDSMLEKFGTMLRKMAAQAAAAQLSEALFGDMGKSGKVGGLAGELFKSAIGAFGGGYGDTAGLAAGVPQYEQGTPWVPNDGLAYLHKGEQVIPAGQSAGGGVVNNVSVVVNSDGGSSQGDSTQAAELGRRIEGAVRAVLMAEKRPRGLLGNG